MFMRLGALCNFYVHKRAAGRRHVNARNYKENSEKPYLHGKSEKCVGIICSNNAQRYLQDAACANFAKEKSKSVTGICINMSDK